MKSSNFTTHLLAAALVILLAPPAVHSQPIHNLPIAIANGNQHTPVVIPAGELGSYILWLDNRASAQAVYCQRLDERGRPQWAAGGLPIALTEGSQLEFAAALEAQRGDLLIAWHNRRSNRDEIYTQRLNRDGNRLWGANGRRIYENDRAQNTPRIVSDMAAGAYVVWQDLRSGTADVYAQRLDAAGARQWAEAGVALVTQRGTQQLRTVAVTSAGILIAGWIDEAANPERFVVQQVDQQGNTLWEEGLALPADGDQSDPRILINHAGNNAQVADLAWLEKIAGRWQCKLQRLTLKGELLWSANGVLASESKDKKGNLSILADGSGGVLAVWQEERSNDDIFAQSLDTNGKLRWGPTGAPVAALSSDQQWPEAIADGAGGLICVWEDERGGNPNVVAQRLNSQGKPQWPVDGLIVTNHGRKNFMPVLAALSGNRVLAAWRDQRNDTGDLYAQLLAADGTLLNVPPVILSEPPTAVKAGESYRYEIVAVDHDASAPPTLQLATAPRWLQLDESVPALQGVPTLLEVGSHQVELRAIDEAGEMTSQAFKVTVVGDTTIFAFVSKPDTVATEDSLYSYRPLTTVLDNLGIAFNLETTATWLNFTGNNVLSGTPRNEHVGEVQIVLEARHSLGQIARQAFSIRVANTNDAPTFVSVPDTVAYVDSLYRYLPQVTDVDRDDRVTISLVTAPVWLGWEAASNLLSGTPPANAGTQNRVVLRAEDRFGAQALQEFNLTVTNLTLPDNTPPSSPIALTLSPSSWNHVPNFTLTWQNPFDPSDIIGVYYKFKTPPEHARDGTYVATDRASAKTEIVIEVMQTGEVALWLWLKDGRGNVDHHTAVQRFYYYDPLPPSPPSQVQMLNATSKWLHTDTLKLAWQPASDSISGVAGYRLTIDDQTKWQGGPEATQAELVLKLAEGRYRLQLTAFDRAGGTNSSEVSSFGIDRTPPALAHVAVDTMSRSGTMMLLVTANDLISGVSEVELNYRAPGELNFQQQHLIREGSGFRTGLTAQQLKSAGLQYFVIATDSAANRSRWPERTAASAYHNVVLYSDKVFSPVPTGNKYFQLVSLPYHPDNHDWLTHLRDNLGDYDPVRWRLFAYDEEHSYLEFGMPAFPQLQPGRACWLVTFEPHSLDFSNVHSLSMEENFELELQPGWNLIGTPFDFPVAWDEVVRPEGVESSLWAFDGQQYVLTTDEMQPWRGYFLRNLSTEPRTLVIPPRCVTCDSSVTNGERVLAPSSKPRVNKLPASVTETMIWALQLRLSDGEYADEMNWLGISPASKEHWDPQDLSEPPPAAGDFVVLRFDHRDWSEYGGFFTTDVRPTGEALYHWQFETLCSRAGRALTLEILWEKPLPANWSLLFLDEAGDAHELKTTESSGGNYEYVFRSNTMQRFSLWLGAPDDLAAAGLATTSEPMEFALLQNYPNPARTSAASNAATAIRFALPRASEVDVRVYDLVGREVAVLLSQHSFQAGRHHILWDGRDRDGIPVPAGVYFYRLQSQDFQQTRKLILLK